MNKALRETVRLCKGGHLSVDEATKIITDLISARDKRLEERIEKAETVRMLSGAGYKEDLISKKYVIQLIREEEE